MSTSYRYTLPVEQSEWRFDGHTDVTFTWEYDENRDGLLQLYSKGKQQQWDAADRIDWSQDLDPENPMEMDDRVIMIYGSDIWNRMTEKERRQVRHHLQASQISQFMHGEQGALIATAKIVQTVPDLDAKFYAATQVMDEARHVEAYSRLLHDKFELAYPITHGLRSLLETGLSDSRWDMTYLTMQILIEGLALAAFQRIRDQSKNPLAAAVNAYVMQDEARHVAFGRLALRDYYPQLSDAERNEREEFVVEACWHMRDRFNQIEVWQRLGLPDVLFDSRSYLRGLSFYVCGIFLDCCCAHFGCSFVSLFKLITGLAHSPAPTGFNSFCISGAKSEARNAAVVHVAQMQCVTEMRGIRLPQQAVGNERRNAEHSALPTKLRPPIRTRAI